MTNDQRMRCIIVYPNAPILYRGEPHSIIEIHLPDNELILCSKENRVNWFKVSQVQIGLRPVSSLTDEECIEVARINEYIDNGFIQREYLINKGMYLAINSCISVTIDYLRSINIITTVNGFDLVAEGVAIVHSEKEGI